MNEIERGQVAASAAEVYDQFFLPALFQEWPEQLLNAARVGPGQRILDIACGTGVLTIAAAARVAPGGFAAGLDVNPSMLAVARRKAAAIEWRQGRAEDLPYPDAEFDAVVSQFGLMFFDDRQAAANEMARVLRPGGRLAVAVWDSLENTPGYAAVTALLRRLFGTEVAAALYAPYNLGNIEDFGSLFALDSLADVTVTTHAGQARFPSLEAWIYTDVKGWTLAGLLDDDQFALLQKEAVRELQRFVQPGGAVAFLAPAHILSARKVG